MKIILVIQAISLVFMGLFYIGASNIVPEQYNLLYIIGMPFVTVGLGFNFQSVLSEWEKCNERTRNK